LLTTADGLKYVNAGNFLVVNSLPQSTSHNRSHISPWCFAAEQMLTESCRLHFDSRWLLCINYLFSRNTALHLLAIFTLVIAIC